MADEAAPQPQPPAGMQRPGIPGAGNILDPAVRGELREQLHPAVHGAAQRAGCRQPGAAPEPAADEEKPAEQPPPAAHRSGPYAHGDVDLSYISANVPSDPIRPQRRRTSRRFYFLAESETTPAAANVPPIPPPMGPKPG